MKPAQKGGDFLPHSSALEPSPESSRYNKIGGKICTRMLGNCMKGKITWIDLFLKEKTFRGSGERVMVVEE